MRKLMAASVWQPHHVRGFLAGLREKVGLTLTSTEQEGGQPVSVVESERQIVHNSTMLSSGQFADWRRFLSLPSLCVQTATALQDFSD